MPLFLLLNSIALVGEITFNLPKRQNVNCLLRHDAQASAQQRAQFRADYDACFIVWKIEK